MNIQKKKLEIIRMIVNTENPDLLDSIKAILEAAFEKDFGVKQMKTQNEDIYSGMEVDENEDFDEFIKKYGV